MQLRRLVLRVLVAAVLVAGAAALVGLAGGDFSDTDFKVIGTSLLFGVAGTLAATGVAVGERPRRWARRLGALTAASTVGAFVLVTYGMWTETDSGAFWRVAGCAGIVALESAHASFVLARRRDDDPPAVGSAALLAVAAAAVSCVLALAPVSGALDDDAADGDAYLQALGIVLVVQIVATVVATLLRRLGGTPPERPLLAPEDPADRLRREILAAADRIEFLAPDPGVRAECDRLRALAAPPGRSSR
jgi:peptidoglycan/LPS O-acetylase OafA/YrhL